MSAAQPVTRENFPKLLSLLDTTEAEREPMSDDIAKMYLQALSLEIGMAALSNGEAAATKPFNVDHPDYADLMRHFPIAVATKRLEASGVPFNISVALALGILPERVADAVQWAYAVYLLYSRKTDKAALVTLDDITRAFPMGFPNEAAMHRIWEAQKGASHDLQADNLLDCVYAWGR